MRKMCSKTDKGYDAALKHYTTTTTTQTTRTQRDRRPHNHHAFSDCMWWHYQPKHNYQPSFFSSSSSSNTITNTSNNNCWSRRRRWRRHCHLWAPLLTIALIVSFWDNCSAAPQSCILCDKEDLKSKASPHESNYEEFLFEHQVTRNDAINALRALNESFYIGPSPDNSCKSVACSKKVMKYCLGPQFINDHCWCEFGHTDEGLPYIPHICYVGEKVYSASVGSCFFYEEVKECCCAPALAKQWRHISAAARPFNCNPLRSVSAALLLVLAAAAY